MYKFISLLSTGLDSPVAAYLMLKKNFHPIFLSFLTFKDQNPKIKNKVIQIVELLSKYTENGIKVYFIRHDSYLEYLMQFCERKLTCILCKRLMIRIAMQIAKKERTNIIVTGDILGEQASQTLDNIYSYNNLIKDFIIIRPLIGLNKWDIININKKLGLYDITSKISTSCDYNPQYPETHAKSHEIQINEFKVRISDMVNNAVKNAELFELSV